MTVERFKYAAHLLCVHFKTLVEVKIHDGFWFRASPHDSNATVPVVFVVPIALGDVTNEAVERYVNMRIRRFRPESRSVRPRDWSERIQDARLEAYRLTRKIPNRLVFGIRDLADFVSWLNAHPNLDPFHGFDPLGRTILGMRIVERADVTGIKAERVAE